MKTHKATIFGTTGVVGQGVMKTLMERSFSIRKLHLLASVRSAGRKLTTAGKEYIVEETTESSSDGMGIVLGVAENDITEKYLPIVTEKGAAIVDNSSAFRLDKQVPLIIPKVNPQAVREHHGTIVNPNCTTIITLVAPQPLHIYANAKCMVVSTYQVVSGADINGICELNQRVGVLAHGREVAVNTFQYQIAYSLIPQIDDLNEAGYPSEEMKMQNEGHKVMSNSELCVDYTRVRALVTCPHSESIMVGFERETSVEKARELLQGVPGVKLVGEPQEQVCPMPLDTTDQDLMFVGYIREDMSRHMNALGFWCRGDQVRREAATDATQVAELVIRKRKRQQE